MLEDLAILTGGRVIPAISAVRSRMSPQKISARPARQFTQFVLYDDRRGGGDPAAIVARRAQVQRQFEVAPPNIEQDKLRERLAKLSGGTAVLYAGGVTPVEQKRTIQLIEDLAARRPGGCGGRHRGRRRLGACRNRHRFLMPC